MANRLTENVDAFLRDRTRRVEVRARKLHILCDLTFEHVRSLFDIQRGCCFYTGVELVLEAGRGRHPHALSFDRVDPAQGYLQGNVVLAANRINSIKQDVTLEEMEEWMPKWAERVRAWRAEGGV